MRANEPDDEAFYDQGTEVRLLCALLAVLDNKVVLDIGAEKGSFTRAFLHAGAEAVYAFEPFPNSVAALRAAFGDTPAVRILELALGASDAPAVLHVVQDKTGRLEDAYHTLVAFEETPALRVTDGITVDCRTLDSLAAEGAIPDDVGIIKIDTERNDFAVLQGMGRVSGAVVMVEYWDDLPETVGPAAYTVADVTALMAERGYANFAVVKRHDQFETIQINNANTQPGDWGDIVFVRDDAFPRLAPVIYEAAARAQERLVSLAVMFAAEASKRGIQVEQIQQAAQDRLVLLDQSVETIQNLLVTSRLEMLDEQELALDAYLQMSHDESIWQWVRPRLGDLFQHKPMPFQVPEHYLRTVPLSSPPTISIVTPTLNGATFLPYTVESILEQEYPALEYVVQDGGSTDETLKLLAAYGERIAHVASEPDTGMAQAINRGFARTTGEIMAYLNADDLLLPGTLAFVAAYFHRHPEVDVVYGHRVLIDANNAEIGRWVLPPHDDAILSWADYVPQETLFWRRGIWEQAGGAMDESFRFALDWDLLLRFREAGAKFVRLPRFLGAFRVHGNQKTSAQLADVGSSEMDRIRERLTGRPVPHADVWQYVEPYMRRHKVYHKLYRLGALRY